MMYNFEGWQVLKSSKKNNKIKLNKKERQFCELVETGYLVKDKNGIDVFWYEYMPSRENNFWYEYQGECIAPNIFSSKIKFDFVKWEDKEPWSIEELLKMEVEDV